MKVSKKGKTFWASALEIQAGAGQDTGSCMPSVLEMPYHDFTLVKVEEVCLTRWTVVLLVKFYYFHLKNCNEKIKSWHY